MINFKLLFAVIVGSLFSLTVAAKTYQCVDDKKVQRRGDTLPPECVNRDYVVMEKGNIVKKVHVLTPEERRAKEAEETKGRLDEAAARDQKRHDKSLTDSYSSVNEIELSRTRSLQQVDARINSLNSQLKIANSRLMGLQKDSQAGAKIPASEIKLAQDRVNLAQQDLDKFNAEKQAIQARYDADKARYKELTGK